MHIDIYSRSANVQKSTAYRAFETTPEAHDLQSTVDKTKHSAKKRVMSQAFSDSALRSLEHHILQHVDEFVNLLPKSTGSEKDSAESEWSASKNMNSWSSWVCFDFMAELVFGRTFDMLKSSEHRYILDLIQSAAFRVGVCLQMPQLAAWNVDRLVAPTIRKLRDRYVQTSRDMAQERMKMDGSRKDLFSHILAARDPVNGVGFTTDEIWGESTLLIVAGSDAISTAMAACFFYLSHHSWAYTKVCEEVRSAFSSSEDIRTGSALQSCVYLKACIDESMRMSPPVGGALWREVMSDSIIDGQSVGKGHDVGVGIYAIHHNASYYPEPYAFRPERWIVGPESSKAAVDAARTAFSAFSIGPVGCMGKNLAYMELMVTMARIIWNLDFMLDDQAVKLEEHEAYLRSYRKHAEYEYRLRDRFTSWKDGPMLRFRARLAR